MSSGDELCGVVGLGIVEEGPVDVVGESLFECSDGFFLAVPSGHASLDKGLGFRMDA